MISKWSILSIASVDKSPYGFPGSQRHLAALSSLAGVSPSASSALPAAVDPLGKLRRTRRAFWRVVRKAEDAGLLAQAKDDNAANGGPERPAGMRALVNGC